MNDKESLKLAIKLNLIKLPPDEPFGETAVVLFFFFIMTCSV